MKSAFVLEYLLANSCSTDNQDKIEAKALQTLSRFFGDYWSRRGNLIHQLK